MADILGVGAYGDIASPAITRKAYIQAHPTQVPPFDDRAALFPLPTPAAPTATGGDAQASVAFTTVAGGATYLVTSTPGGFAATGTASPVVVLGLANGTAYTFKVAAADVHGQPSLDSPASGAVTPAGS